MPGEKKSESLLRGELTLHATEVSVGGEGNNCQEKNRRITFGWFWEK